MPAETITGNEFLDSLLEKTPAAPSQPRRGQNYNYPERLYVLPDGRVERLQGDPHNRAYYEDKGYHLLGETPGRDGRKSEVRQYLEDERPKLIKEQVEKAKLINAIRGNRDPSLNLETSFDGWSLEQLRLYLAQIKEETGKTVGRVIVPRNTPRGREEAAEAALLRGVDTTESMSIEALEQRRSARPPRPGGTAA